MAPKLLKLCLKFVLIKNRFVTLNALKLVGNILRDVLVCFTFSSLLFVTLRTDRINIFLSMAFTIC